MDINDPKDVWFSGPNLHFRKKTTAVDTSSFVVDRFYLSILNALTLRIHFATLVKNVFSSNIIV